MYEVYLDGRILDYPGDEECVILEPKLDLALNDAGSFEFLLPPSNPEYGSILNKKSMVQVLKDGEEIFNGEVIECEKDADSLEECFAVGELAFLSSSIQPQAVYHDLSPRQMLDAWLNIHNTQVEERKKFYTGIVTIHDSNDSIYRFTDRESTLDAIREKLVKKLGGYLRIRKSGGKRYLDWISLEQYGKYSSQPIEFGENLLDYAENLSAADVATAIIPLGARLDESPIEGLEGYTDITSVNNGKDYLYIPGAVERFGWNRKVVKWKDVTLPENLKEKGEEWLRDNQYEAMVLDIRALDLSMIDPEEYEDFRLGDRIHAYAEPYGMDRVFPVQSMRIFLHEPSKNKLLLGDKQIKTYTKHEADTQKQINAEEEENRRITTDWMKSAVDNLTQMMTGSEGGYKIEEYDDEKHWLRTLIMDAPDKEHAQNVLQFNKYGIGGSHNGFNGPYTVGMTLDGTIIGERIKAGSVQAEALSVEYKAGVTAEITAKFKVAENLISAEVKRATGQEVELAASIKVTSDLVQTKVSKGEFGTYMQQYYNYFLYGFNGNSKYVQINPGEIAIYDNGVTDSKKRSAFDQNGNHFWRDGYYVGKIGTNQWKQNPAHKGLVFDLDIQGKYMAFAYREAPNDDEYTTMWTFSRSNSMFSKQGLHAGCDIDMHNWTMRNVKVENLQAGGYLGWNGEIPIITEIHDNGDGSVGWSYSSITVSNGIITSAPR